MVLINRKFYFCLAFLFWKFHYIKSDTDINICENVTDHIFIQDIDDCTKYFVCVNGRAKWQQCRAGLYFDANLQACVASSQNCLKCPQRKILHLPLVKTCDKYILCYYGKPWLRKCENNEQFNRITGKCDHPYNVDCVDNRCSIHAVDELIYTASSKSCEMYYACLGGKAKMMSCAPGLQFSTKCNCCDKAEKVRCMIEMPPPSPEIIKEKRLHTNSNEFLHTPTLVGEVKSVKCPLTGNFILPYIGNKDYYITCIDGKGTMYACGSGYQFDDKLRRCVIKEEDNDEEIVENFSNKNRKLSRESYAKQCPQFGASIMAHEENNKYIVCVNGRAEVYKCPTEQYFDATENICRNMTEIKRRRYGTIVDEFAGIVCPKYASFTFPHQDRHKFYLCLDGKATVFTCADDEYFDVTTHNCQEEKEEQEEENLNISLNNEEFDYASTPFDNKCPRTGNTTLPHAKRNQYYLCIEGKSAIFTCAKDLIYDDKLKNCTEDVKDHELYLPEVTNIMCPKFGTFKFPHANKTYYYLCLDGKTYTLACDENEYFDVEINLCKVNETLVLLKQNATLDISFDNNTNNTNYNTNNTFENSTLENPVPNNNNTSRLALTSVASELVSNVICPQNGTFIYPHAQRNRYYVCIEGSAIVFTCVQGYSFNIKTNTCVRDQQSSVEDNNQAQSPMVLDEPVNIICPAIGAMKFAHEDRNKFYLCINGMGTVLACANGTFYDQEAGACLLDTILETENSTLSNSIENSTFPNSMENSTFPNSMENSTFPNSMENSTLSNNTEIFISCPLKGNFIYAHNDTQKYYVCMEGQLFTLTCPDGLQFDVEEKVCRKPRKIFKLPPLILNETSTVLCPPSGVYKYAHIKENKFYLCINGMGSVLACPDVSIFDPETGDCLALNVTQTNNFNNLTWANTTQENNTNLTINTNLTQTLNLTCPLQGTFLYALKDPQKYAVCLNGSALEFTCPKDLIFNRIQNKCLPLSYADEDYWNNFECPPNDTLMFPHKDANKFYLCLNGLAIEQECSRGYLFDKETRTCSEASSVQKQFKISLNIQCPKEGTYKVPHIEKHKFYLCVDGVASVFSCAKGEYFDAENETCYEQVNVNKLLRKNDLCPLQGTTKLPHPDRNKYYLCIDGLSTTYSCAEGDYFDAESETCREAKENRKVKYNTKEYIECPPKGSLKLQHNDPNKFYLCSDGFVSIHSCAKGDVFDAKSETCREANDNDTKDSRKQHVFSEHSFIFNCPENGTTKFPHPDSNKFYLCLEGVPIIESCLEGDFYDEETETCRKSNNKQSNTANKEYLSGLEITSNDTENINCPIQGSAKLPHNDPNKFYLCLDGNAYIQYCEVGDFFDVETLTCRQSTGINQIVPITLGNVNQYVNCPLEGSAKLPHNDPNKFYLCLDGIASIQSCAKGDIFDIETETCLENSEVKQIIRIPVGNTKLPNNLQQITSSDIQYVKCPLEGSVKLPHDNTNKFYLCVNGVAYIQDCAEGDVFDAESETCREANDDNEKNTKDSRKQQVSSEDIYAFNCPEEGSAKFPHPDSNKFYLCLQGIPIIESCMEGDFYDAEMETCRERNNKENDFSNKEFLNSFGQIDLNNYQNVNCPLQGSAKLPHNDPNKFYLCLDGNAYIQYCKVGDFFDVKTLTCRQSTGINQIVPITLGNDNQNVICPLEGSAKLPHKDPNKFYLCLDGIASIQSCAKGDIFDIETETCLENSEVKQIIQIPVGNTKLPNNLQQSTSNDIQYVMCPLEGSVKLPHDNTNKFYLCVDGVAYIQDCAEGDVFDAESETCREANDVNEKNTKDYRKQQVSSEDYYTFNCPEEGSAKFPHPDSNKFYLCLEGVPIIESCMEGDFYDAEMETCQERNNEQENTSNKEYLNSLEQITLNNTRNVNCPKDGSAKFPHPDSNKFYLCLEGVPIIESCMEGDFYDAEMETCREGNNKQNITPNKEHFNKLDQTTSNDTQNVNCPFQGSAKLPHNDPNKFYLCLEGIASIQSCAKGDFFDIETETCRESHGIKQILTIPNKHQNSLQHIASNDNQNVDCPLQGSSKLPHNDPNKFYLCLDGFAYIQTCAEGDVFDAEIETCREANDNDNTENNTKDSQKQLVSSEDSFTFICPEEGSAKFPHPDSNKFYLCLEGVTIIESCMEGDFYDTEMQTCRKRNNEQNITPNKEYFDRLDQTTSNDTQNVSCPFQGSAKLPHNDPNKFYLCLEGTAFIQSCANGYFFDVETETCRESPGIKPILTIPNKHLNSLQHIASNDNQNVDCPLQGSSKLPHNNPNKFYLCLDGFAYIQTCAEGDVFDTESETCREANDNDNIENNTKDYQKQLVSSEDSYTFICPEEGSAKFPHPDSNKFYLCLEGVTIIESCMEGDFYDTEMQTCRKRNNEQNITPNKEYFDRLDQTTSNDTQNVSCPFQGSAKLPHNDPNKFYLCLEGIAFIQSCANGYFFDIETETCRESPGIKQILTIPNKHQNSLQHIASNDNQIDCPLQGSSKLPHNDPNKFYLCLDGFVYIQACADGDVFDAESETCREAKDNDNIENNTKDYQKQLVSSGDSFRFNCPEEGSAKFPHPDSNKFYLCLEGVLIIESCMEGDFYDAEMETCRERNNKQKNTPNKEYFNSMEQAPSNDTQDVNCPSQGLAKLPHNDPNKFYLCLDGIASIQSCAKGDFFDVQSKICRRTPSISIESNEIINTLEDSDYVKCPVKGSAKLPHTDTNKFYLCLEGLALLQSCAEGDFYDVENEICRAVTENVKCPLHGSQKLPHDDPNKFYLCFDGIATVQSCSKGYYFDKETEMCRETLASNILNNKDTITTKPVENANKVILVSDVNNIECPPQGSLRLPHPNPNMFYLCLEGLTIVENCAEGDIFDAENLICKEDRNTNLPPILIEEINETTTFDFKEIENVHQDLKNKGLEQTITTSTNSIEILDNDVNMKENPEEAFNSKDDENIVIELKEISTIPQKTSGTLNTNDISEEFSNSKDDKNEQEIEAMKLKETLNSYEIIEDFKENPEETLKETLPTHIITQNSKDNESTNVNDDASELQEVATISQETSETENIDCPSHGSITIPHPTDQNKFFLCDNGLATIELCPAGESFDTKLLICREIDSDVNVIVKNPIENENTAAEESITIICPSKGFALISHDDPEKFYLCEDGIVTVQTCAEGKYYNAENGKCEEKPAIENELTNFKSNEEIISAGKEELETIDLIEDNQEIS